MEKTVGKIQKVSTPTPYLMERPWKADALKNLPAYQLQQWHENLSAASRLDLEDFTLLFQVGGKSIPVELKPRRIFLPDGTFRYVEPGHETPQGSDRLKLGVTDEIKAILLNGIKDTDLEFKRFGQSPESLISDVVDTTIGYLLTYGLERGGLFIREDGKLQHAVISREGHGMRVEVNRYVIDEKEGFGLAGMTPYIKTGHPKVEDLHIRYHLHPQLIGTKPSDNDVKILLPTPQSATLIATPSGEDFTVTEWRVKEGVDMQRQIRTKLKHQDKAGLDEFIENNLQWKDYVLRKQGDLYVFEESEKPKPAPKPPGLILGVDH